MSARSASEMSEPRVTNSSLKNVIVIGAVVVVVGVAALMRFNRSGGDSATASAPTVTGLPRMLDLGADKCIPCKEMAPILVELRKEYDGKAAIDFIDVWKYPAAAEPYGVRVIPTQIFFDREGKEVWRHEGFLPKAEIVAKLKELGAG